MLIFVSVATTRDRGREGEVQQTRCCSDRFMIIVVLSPFRGGGASYRVSPSERSGDHFKSNLKRGSLDF